MLFPVKRAHSISSADQYLVSGPQTTEVNTTSSCPLLLKYHNIGDSHYFLLEDCPPEGASVVPATAKNFYSDYSDSNSLRSLPSLQSAASDEEDTMPYSNDHSPHGLNGLYNLENTCFLNSIIQCLRFTKPLFVYIMKDRYLDDLSGNNPILVDEFAKLVKELWSFSQIPRNAVSPRQFTKAMHHFAPEFDGYTQQDAHEFLLRLLTGLHENLNLATSKWPVKATPTDILQGQTMWQNYLKSDNSRIINLFVGQLRSTLTCTYCNKTSSNFEPFWDLSLPIPSSADDTTSIQQCLRACLDDERIDGSNMPYCSRCKCPKPSRKQLSIHKLPRVLILHLKRFTEDQEKLNTMVEFPVKNLDIFPFCSGGVKSGAAKYNLYAVVNHTGSLSYGHYTAFCNNPLMNEWFEFNDHHVIPVDCPECVITDRAYILFYELWGQSSKL